jgi:hypothetical protein
MNDRDVRGYGTRRIEVPGLRRDFSGNALAPIGALDLEIANRR